MNVRKLKAAIVESGKLRDDLAEGLGMSRSAFSAKINGHREFSFKEAEGFRNSTNVKLPISWNTRKRKRISAVTAKKCFFCKR